MTISSNSTSSYGDIGYTSCSIFRTSSRYTCSRIIIKLTHRTICTTTIYIMVYSGRLAGISFTDSHLSITLDNTCSYIIGTCRIHITLTTTIDITEFSTALACRTNSTARDIHSGISCYCTHLTTTINTTLDDSTIDVHSCRLCCCQQCPMIFSIERSAIQLRETTHAAAKHITTMFTLCIVCKFFTDSSAINSHGDISSFEAVNRISIIIYIVWTHHAIRLYSANYFIYQIETIAYRCQSATTIDTTEHISTINDQIDSTAYITSSQCLATESTATTEHVTIHVCGT